MASRYPIIKLTREVQQLKRIKGGKVPFPRKLPYERQAERLGAKFDEVARSVLQTEKGINVAADPRAVVPERALVLELIGPVADFEVAASSLGFEWLASMPADGEFEDDEGEDATDTGSESVFEMPVLYLTMPSERGLQQLLASWRRFKSGKEPNAEEKPLWALFGYLKDLHTWSARERIEPSINRYVTQMLHDQPDKPVKVELDLWYRSERQKRDSAIATVRKFVVEFGGKELDFVEIPEIQYQGLLIEIPAHVALALLQQSGDLPNLKEVMTIRPQAAFEPSRPTKTHGTDEEAVEPDSLKPCLAAILDGYPVTDHDLLKGRVIVVESDVKALAVPVAGRVHGTAMCSLVLRGDLDKGEPVLNRPVLSIPVLGWNATTTCEEPPGTKLAIGVIHRALQTLVKAKQTDHRLKDVVLVNHSLCDTNAPFIRRPSPWAALLDYFSHRHQLLVIASAGNIMEPFPCAYYADRKELAKASDVEREANFLLAIEQSKATRGMFSPAESINALTVGALHSDDAPPAGPGEIDPFRLGRMTNIASAVGLGVNKSIKPDLVHDGGRYLARATDIKGGGVNVYPTPGANVGQRAACPSRTGDLSHDARSSGTSNAAALVTRSCIQMADALEAAFSEDEESWLERPTRAVVLKALAAHSCSWGKLGDLLDSSFPPPPESRRTVARRTTIARFLGFGRLNGSHVVSGRPSSATLLGDGIIKPEDRHEYRVPVPAAFLKNRDVRRVILTLAWSAPVITTIADYRGVSVELSDESGQRLFWKGVKRVPQPPGRRGGEPGTVQHIILEGKTLQNAFADPKGICVGVQARQRHPMHKTTAVPYALAVTVELAQTARASQLYAQVREAIRERMRSRART